MVIISNKQLNKRIIQLMVEAARIKRIKMIKYSNRNMINFNRFNFKFIQI